jgi:hypothetical protein
MGERSHPMAREERILADEHLTRIYCQGTGQPVALFIGALRQSAH